MKARKPYVDDGRLGINLPPEQQRWDGTRFTRPWPEPVKSGQLPLWTGEMP